LLQTPVTFALGGEKSFAAKLAREGYDVWLGNNRANLHSMQHDHLQAHESKFWATTIDGYAADMRCMCRAVLRHTKQEHLGFIGHSQGAAQAVAGLCEDAELRDHVKLCCLLAPAGFVQPFHCWPSAWLRRAYNMGWFRDIMGEGRFLDFPCWLKPWVGPKVMAYLMCIFYYELLGWSTASWGTKAVGQFMAETPGGAGNRVLEHWIQLEQSGMFSKFDFGTAEENMEVYGQVNAPIYPVQQMDCPSVLIYGGLDDLVDAPKLIKQLPNVVFSHKVDHHEHMDSLLASDADREVFNHVVEQLRLSFPAS